MFKSIRSPRAFEAVVEQIRQAIFDGKVAAGDRLPTERELSRLFGVSRMTLREAIRVLERSGLLRIQAGGGGGTFVADGAADAIGNAFVTLFNLKGLTVADFYQARALFEVPVTAEVARQRNPETIRRLEQNLSLYRKTPSVEIARDFHLIIAGALGNRLIEQLLHAMATFSEKVNLDDRFGERAAPMTFDDHRQIYEAIRDGDPERTRQVMADHLYRLAKVL